MKFFNNLVLRVIGIMVALYLLAFVATNDTYGIPAADKLVRNFLRTAAEKYSPEDIPFENTPTIKDVLDESGVTKAANDYMAQSEIRAKLLARKVSGMMDVADDWLESGVETVEKGQSAVETAKQTAGSISKLINTAQAILDKFSGEDQKPKAEVIPPEELKTGNRLAMTVLDVGSASCAYLTLPDGSNVLVDLGATKPGSDLKKKLDSYGLTDIDAFILTHPHYDHLSDYELLEDLDPELVITRLDNIPENLLPTTKAFADFLDYVILDGIPTLEPEAGSIIYSKDDTTIVALGPIDDDYEDLNEFSLVLKVTYKDQSFLLMGDAGVDAEADLLASYSPEILDCDVLLVGHHGSKSATSKEFLDVVTPKYAVISCDEDGDDPDYDLPNENVLKRLDQAGSIVLRTDEKGDITLVTDGQRVAYK